MNKNEKVSSACIRVLEILKALAEKPCSIEELLRRVENLEKEVYTKVVIVKYLTTLKAIGFKITKVDDLYYLENGINQIDLDEEETSVLMHIQDYAKSLEESNLKENLTTALQTLEKSLSIKTKESNKPDRDGLRKHSLDIYTNGSQVLSFEKYCTEKLKLEIEYKNITTQKTENYKIAPMEVIHSKGHAFLVGYDYINNQYKRFLISSITNTKQSPQKVSCIMPATITFKLTNRLANSYVLKEGEIIMEKTKDYIIISNKNEDRELLLRRLLRYHDDCEILYPKEYRHKITELISEIEKIYE